MQCHATVATESRWLAVSPPAKLNLHLEVTGRRADGFHELDMVMVAIDWRDELKIRLSPTPGIRLSAEWSPSRESIAASLGLDSVPADDPRTALLDIPSDHRNLVAHALTDLSDTCRLRGGWDVDLRKRIPSGAGMGGASSDAAAAIRVAATLLWKHSAAPPEHPIHDPVWREQTVREVALRTGSDVPFFLQQDSACHATGRGEQLTPVPFLRPLHFVVVYPPVSLSTGTVYSQLGLSSGHSGPPWQPKSSEKVIAALRRGDTDQIPLTWVNRLQPVARGLSSRIDQAIECFQHAGVHAAMMTGSGSACFGLVNNVRQREQVATRMRQALGQTALIQQVASCPASSSITNA